MPTNQSSHIHIYIYIYIYIVLKGLQKQSHLNSRVEQRDGRYIWQVSVPHKKLTSWLKTSGLSQSISLTSVEQKPFVSNNSLQTNKLKCTYNSSVHYTEHRNVGFQIDGQCVRQVRLTTSQVNTVLLPTGCSPVYDFSPFAFWPEETYGNIIPRQAIYI